MKKESNNKLKCQISGDERISNKTYLSDKAYKYGITVTEWKAFYVKKSALKGLKNEVEDNGVDATAKFHSRTEEDIRKMVSYNGGGGFLKRLHDKRDKALTRTLKHNKKQAEVALSTDDAAVALELATAEIVRTKVKLEEKNRDRKNARRRELYAAKKSQLVTA
jgi:hypothetical protein